MWHLGLAWLPVVIVALTAIMMTMSYTIAVLDGHVATLFPYISDTGGHPPESCFFSQLFNMVAILVLCGSYVRYKQLQCLDGAIPEVVYKLNKVGLFLGAVVAAGMSLVANFQDTTIIKALHFLGASLIFLPGVIYAALHTIISYKLYPEHNSQIVCTIRLMVTIVTIIAVFLSAILGILASYQWDPPDGDDDKFKWKPEDGGYIAHLISTFCEWILGLGFVCYYGTFFHDFRKVDLKMNMRLHVDPFPVINEETHSISSAWSTEPRYA
ncbi:DNA damage-regulated autophagy modulator protein 1-like [Amphiura filiformis]|uniref:DNA damage-regulated autophagy modulator protein 1-like n=1 Tax=Amphiura filiformis TaxID=82378 RepID=UPI003B227247